MPQISLPLEALPGLPPIHSYNLSDRYFDRNAAIKPFHYDESCGQYCP